MPSVSEPQFITLRTSSPEDCAHLALLADMATRRLTSFLWNRTAPPGQSAFEVGRNIIRNDTSHFTHFKNWRIAEHQGHIVGALNGYAIPEFAASATASEDVTGPLNELKALAVGTWYISAAAVYPEYRGRGVGKFLVAEADAIARDAQKDQVTLMVGDFNPGAYNLYRRSGFREWARRPFHPFPGSDEPGEWILMVKDLG